MIVYKFPPVGVTGWEWTVADPIDISRSLISGRRYASAAQRRRVLASLSVGGARGDAGGYMEALKRLLQGGVAGVRLTARPTVWGALPAAETRQAEPVRWTTGDETLAWTAGGEAMSWFTGAIIGAAITTVGGLPGLLLTGLPPSALVGRVGEPVTVYPEYASQDGAQSRVLLRRLVSDASGVATAVVDAAFTVTGRADVGVESGVFEALDMPRAPRRVGENWFYDWSFAQVFADEVGGFEEIDPWA